jgi:hypothetical protein
MEAGRRYLAAGLSIIWLSGKAPNPDIHPHGLQQPMSGAPEGPEDDELLRWAAGHEQTTGIGIVIPEHLCVVDVDGEAGAVSLWGLIGRTPDTATGKSARGLHFWFVSPYVHRSTKLGEGLDFKAVGGYVAVAPSLHPSGVRYEWINPLIGWGGLPDAGGCDWLPDEIEAVLARKAAKPVLDPALRSATLDGLVKHLRNAQEGNRNAAAYWAGCCARDGGHSLDDALAQLVPALVHAGLPEPEARRTIRSAYNQGR